MGHNWYKWIFQQIVGILDFQKNCIDVVCQKLKHLFNGNVETRNIISDKNYINP